MLSDLFFENYVLFRNIKRLKIHEIITFANAKTKIQYDNKYKSVNMKIKKKIYLNFHYEYILFEFTNKNLLSQRNFFYFTKNKIADV